MKLVKTVGIACSVGLFLSLVNCTGDDDVELEATTDGGSSSSSSGRNGSSSGQNGSSSGSSGASSSSGSSTTDAGQSSTMANLFARLRPAATTGTFTASAGTTIQLPGVTFTIPPNAIFASAAGCDDFGTPAAPPTTRVTGEVSFEALGYRTAGDMLRGDRPTVTTDGTWIESGGAFEVRVTAGGQRACIIDLKDIRFTAPAGVSTSADMQFWVGDSGGEVFEWKLPTKGSTPQRDAGCDTVEACGTDACLSQLSCRELLCTSVQACRNDVCLGTASCPANPACTGEAVCSGGDEGACTGSAECRIACQGNCAEARCANAPTCKPAPIFPSGTPPEYFFNSSPFGRIGNYDAANCDRLTSLPGDKITVKVLFASNYSAESGVFFIPTALNTAVKLYTRLTGSEQGYASYTESMPAGVAGKLVAMALKDGKYFYEEQALTLAGAAGATQTITVNPVEVSEAQFDAAVTAL